jgi:hypothetical protein
VILAFKPRTPRNCPCCAGVGRVQAIDLTRSDRPRTVVRCPVCFDPTPQEGTS